MRVREVAERLDVSESTVYSLIASGKLRHCRVGQGRGVLRISEEQLAEYLKQAEPAAPPAASAPSPRQVTLKHLKLN